MRLFTLIFTSCFACTLLSADKTPFPLGAADLVSDARLNEFKSPPQFLSLEEAFEYEAGAQLDLNYDEMEGSSDFYEYKLGLSAETELLKRENAELKRRVTAVESRLSVIEAKLSE